MSYTSDDDFYKLEDLYSRNEYSTNFFFERLDQETFDTSVVMVSVGPSDLEDYNEIKEILNVPPKFESKVEEMKKEIGIKITDQIESYMQQMKKETNT